MKMRSALPLVLIAAVLAISACVSTVTGGSGAADTQTPQSLDEQWSATAGRNDLDGTVAF